MRKFNPDKELRKIQKGNKNKIILLAIFLLVVGVIGYSFAIYQVRYSKRIIYTKVGDFSKDVNILAVFVDNDKADDFPAKNQGKIFDKIVCDNNNDNHVSAYWDYDKWGLVVETTKKAKCNVFFKTGTDTSGANPPELYQGLIPVTFDTSGNVKVADTSKEWYNYDNHRWANAVLVTNDAYERIVKEDGTYDTNESLSLDGDILQMYVWIPRYKYELFNANFESVKEQMINIKFETNTETTGRTKCEIASNGKETCIYDDNGEWFTHPAFTFGNTELTGIWVGKFEPSEKDSVNTTANLNNNSIINSITILPNKVSIVFKSLQTIHEAVRSIDEIHSSEYNLLSSEIDTHIMKNREWGAVAYLSMSKYGLYNNDGKSCTIENCNVYINNVAHGASQSFLDGTITGCSGTTVNAAGKFSMNACENGRTWDKEGAKASTTNNLYGIYDMSGGMWDYVMGDMTDTSGLFNPSLGFTKEYKLDEKYYDKYDSWSNNLDIAKGHLGDATRETVKTSDNAYGGWYGDGIFFNNNGPWYARGGSGVMATGTGFITSYGYTGAAHSHYSFRVVLTAQDGNT